MGFDIMKDNRFLYLTKLGDIFPIDIDIEAKEETSFMSRLRPEFLMTYSKDLSSDAFLNQFNYENEIDDIEVAEAGKFLRSEKLPAFLEYLEKLVVFPNDSISLTQVLQFLYKYILYIFLYVK